MELVYVQTRARRGSRDNRGTRIHESGSRDFGDLRFLNAGSIPAASTNLSCSFSSSGPACGKRRHPCRSRVAVL